MKDGFIKVRCVSAEVTSGNIKGNAEKIKALIDESEKNEIKILATQELSLCGYSSYDLMGQSTILNSCKKALEDIKNHTRGKDVLALVGAPLSNGEGVYDCAVLIKGGEILGIVPKENLSSDEKRVFKATNGTKIKIGEKFYDCKKAVFECESIEGLTIGVEIGKDILTNKTNASVVLAPSATFECVGKEEERRLIVKAKSLSNNQAYLYVDAPESETTTDVIYSAHNIICENGEILAESKPFEEKNGDTVSEIDVNRLSMLRAKTAPAADDERGISFKLKTSLTELTRRINPYPFLVKAEDTTKILEIQARALARRLQASYSKKMVIGISGGLDSTIALLVAVRTADILKWERNRIVAVTMPCFGTTDRTKSNALSLCEEYGVDLREIPILDAVRVHFDDINHSEDNRNVTYENAQARERTQVLMDVANDENGIVIGTGDLSEIALGWCTYNADHMSMYNVNSSLPKTLIRQMLSFFAKTSSSLTERKIILDILDTPVSPELLPADENGEIAQKTEEAVGSYALNDFFLYNMIYMGFAPSKTYRLACIAFENKMENEEIYETLEKFIKRFFSQQFKRSCSPDGIQASKLSLSPRGALKMASDMSPSAYLDELETNI